MTVREEIATIISSSYDSERAADAILSLIQSGSTETVRDGALEAIDQFLADCSRTLPPDNRLEIPDACPIVVSQGARDRTLTIGHLRTIRALKSAPADTATCKQYLQVRSPTPSPDGLEAAALALIEWRGTHTYENPLEEARAAVTAYLEAVKQCLSS